MIPLREAVALLPAEERLEYVLACWEALSGQDNVQQDVDGAHLTLQQALIFALLKRRLGRPVSADSIIFVLDAGRRDASTTIVLVRSQITHIRRKLTGKYRISRGTAEGYTLTRAGKD